MWAVRNQAAEADTKRRRWSLRHASPFFFQCLCPKSLGRSTPARYKLNEKESYHWTCKALEDENGSRVIAKSRTSQSIHDIKQPQTLTNKFKFCERALWNSSYKVGCQQNYSFSWSALWTFQSRRLFNLIGSAALKAFQP